jgi:hypothetical protein
MNSSASRHKRVPPERRGPVRNPIAAPLRDKVDSAAAGPAAPGVLREALECGVQTAYTVIDQYMRRGYEAARSNQNHPDGRGHMSDGTKFGGRPTGPWGPFGAPLEMWMGAVRAWTEAWSAFMPGMTQNAFNPAAMMGFPPCPPAAAPTVSIYVSSERPTEVTASMSPCTDLNALETSDLTSDTASQQMKGISISGGLGNTVRINVPVTADQPPGTYRGRISCRGLNVGSVTVVITGPAKAT